MYIRAELLTTIANKQYRREILRNGERARADINLLSNNAARNAGDRPRDTRNQEVFIRDIYDNVITTA